MKKPTRKPTTTVKEISMVKEREIPKKQLVKEGDLTKDGMKVVKVLDDGRVLVSSQTCAKVISQEEM